jgi:hydrogenase expression/formation protein HypC
MELIAGRPLPFARVRFGSVVREVCTVYTPEAAPGDFVIVHVGFAIQTLEQEAAQATLDQVARLR